MVTVKAEKRGANMPSYRVKGRYTIDFTIWVDADDEERAEDMVVEMSLEEVVMQVPELDDFDIDIKSVIINNEMPLSEEEFKKIMEPKVVSLALERATQEGQEALQRLRDAGVIKPPCPTCGRPRPLI
jgi:hypothetical protein